jgi:hypothetical protein
MGNLIIQDKEGRVWTRNPYRGSCSVCGGYVAAGAGLVSKVSFIHQVAHMGCVTPVPEDDQFELEAACAAADLHDGYGYPS